MSTLSNPAYSQLIVQLNLAKRHLEAAKSIADELVRDHMLTDENVLLGPALGYVECVEARIRQHARSTP